MKIVNLFFAVSIMAVAGFVSLSRAEAAPMSQVAKPSSVAVDESRSARLLLVQDDDYGRGRWRWGYRRYGGDGDGEDWRYRRRFFGDGEGDGDDWRRRRMRREWCYYHPGRC
jgi:hypothetical protein